MCPDEPGTFPGEVSQTPKYSHQEGREPSPGIRSLGPGEEIAEQATPHWGKKGSRGGEAAVTARSVSLDFFPNFSLLLLLTHSENSDRNSN